MGIGITFIDMSVGNVKEADRRSFDLTTPYRIFSFSTESEQEKENWLEAMQGAIAEALSTSEVAERIWAADPNRFCADCGAPQPDWASINLCIVICKRCAGMWGWACVCVWDMLGRVIVVVVMVGRWVLHVAVLGMVPVHQCRGWALGGPQVRGRLRRSRGRVGLGRELPPLTPE